MDDHRILRDLCGCWEGREANFVILLNPFDLTVLCNTLSLPTVVNVLHIKLYFNTPRDRKAS